MKRPQLFISDFSDQRGQVSYYLERVRDCSIRKPAEVLVDFSLTGDFREEAEAIHNIMQTNGWNKAFLKTDCKAAVNDLKSGSYIFEPSVGHIQSTVESLITQNTAQNWPHGQKLVLREWLDLNFCSAQHTCHPEVRCFIGNGEILGWTPKDIESTEFVCAACFSHLEPIIDTYTHPEAMARILADEFTEASWGVDFALDTSGDWYFIEMNFNGIRWDDQTENWVDITGQGDHEPYGPIWTHGAALPTDSLSEQGATQR